MNLGPQLRVVEVLDHPMGAGIQQGLWLLAGGQAEGADAGLDRGGQPGDRVLEGQGRPRVEGAGATAALTPVAALPLRRIFPTQIRGIRRM